MKKLLTSLIAFGLTFGALAASLETAYDADASTTSTVLISPARAGGQIVVKAVSAVSTNAAATIKYYGRTGSPAASVSNGLSASRVYVSNASYAFTNNDEVVFHHAASGVSDYRTITNSATTYVELSSAVSEATGDGDKLYELTQIGQVNIGTTAYSEAGDAILATPADSPLRVVNGGSGGNTLTVTVQK